MDKVVYIPAHVRPIKSLKSQRKHPLDTRMTYFFMEFTVYGVVELSSDYDAGCYSSCLHEVCTTHSGAFEPTAILFVSAQLSASGLLWWLSGRAQCEVLLSVLSLYPPLLLDCSLLVTECLPDGAPRRHQSGSSTKLSPHLTMSEFHRLRPASFQELPSQYNYPCSSWSQQVSWKDCQHQCSTCLVITVFQSWSPRALQPTQSCGI